MLQRKASAYERLSPAYEESMQNPSQAERAYPDLGAWHAVFQAEIAGSYEDECLQKKDLLLEKEKLKEEADSLAQREKGKPEVMKKEAKRLWKDYLIRTADIRALDSVKSLIQTGEDNPYEVVLRNAASDSEDWMEEYGVPIMALERDMMKFWFSLSKEKIEAMANKIVNAFLHGFISQSRDRKDRKRVRFFYQIGQEALAQKVLCVFKEKGLDPVVMAPHSLYKRNQFMADHQFDRFFIMDRELFEKEFSAYAKALECYTEELRDTCGMVGIDQFGADVDIVRPDEKAFRLDETSKKFSALLGREKAEMEARLIHPSDISFCKVAFPNMLIGNDFKEIFEDFYDMNLVVSEPYEILQQKLIDSFDTCDYVKIKGYKGNKTDIKICLWPLEDPDCQTKFLNCGGDLNIPYGEVFTTPRLHGTEGVFHVEEICLNGVFYHDLQLVFEDGWVTDVSCEEGKEYAMENLLHPVEKITMGEFAIGTNTKAYSIAEKYKIGSRLPILIYEKMGPHIAIGDPCFARSEDAAVYNMYDGKDMICRENEVTSERKNKKDVYFGKHVDITLPYHQVEYVRGFRADQTSVDLILHGRFVLEGTKSLNEGLQS